MTCQECPFWKRLFCLFACEEVNEILNRIDKELERDDDTR